MSGTTTGAGPGLHEEMRAVEREYAGWHLYMTDAGTIWAVTCHTPWRGGGVTLDAPTPELMRHEIAAEIHRWARAV